MISITLSSTSEYALRAMSWLALQPKEVPVTASALSEGTSVPISYLLKIMRRLVSAGLVDSARGQGGGFTLAKPPGRISYMEILEASGYGSQPEECVFGWDKCRGDRPCPMHQSWSALNNNFIAWARSTTLATVRGQFHPTEGEPEKKPRKKGG